MARLWISNSSSVRTIVAVRTAIVSGLKIPLFSEAGPAHRRSSFCILVFRYVSTPLDPAEYVWIENVAFDGDVVTEASISCPCHPPKYRRHQTIEVGHVSFLLLLVAIEPV